MSEEIDIDIQSRYHRVLEKIEHTAIACNRSPGEIQLVVVTKGHSAEKITALYNLGVRLVGENRVEEALAKQAQLQDLDDLQVHMIGHLQSRKAANLAGNFPLIHSIDSTKLARRIDRFAGEANIIQNILLQFNTSGEQTKSGFSAVSGIIKSEEKAAIEVILSLNHLRIHGLMTLAPYSPNPQDARPTFNALRRLREELAQRYPQTNWSQLSMGMSGDYQVAIEEGATLLRIGTAILG